TERLARMNIERNVIYCSEFSPCSATKGGLAQRKNFGQIADFKKWHNEDANSRFLDYESIWPGKLTYWMEVNEVGLALSPRNHGHRRQRGRQSCSLPSGESF